MGNHPKNLFTIILLAFLFFSPHQSLIFAEMSSGEDKLNKEFLINFKNDFTEVIISPKNWDGQDILSLSAVLGAGIILYAADQDIHDWFQKHRSSPSEDISKVVSHFGNGVYIAGLITALYASGEVSDNNSLRKTALLSLESWLTSGVIVVGLKFITGRARPKTGESSHTFHPISIRSSYLSFPSGHASSAFAVASTIADQSEKIYIDILAYSLATLVAVSRVHDSKHWASDVFIGSAIGYAVGKKIAALNRSQNSGKLKISFQFSQNRQAVSLYLCF